MNDKLGPMKMTIAGSILLGAGLVYARQNSDSRRIEVTFSGGYETDPRDRGRPVALVAGALGVKPEVFREAFSRVRPARDGAPTPERAQENKWALLSALGKYGITNERLDEVSNRYRYRRERGERWPTSPAKAYAIVSKTRSSVSRSSMAVTATVPPRACRCRVSRICLLKSHSAFPRRSIRMDESSR